MCFLYLSWFGQNERLLIFKEFAVSWKQKSEQFDIKRRFSLFDWIYHPKHYALRWALVEIFTKLGMQSGC